MAEEKKEKRVFYKVFCKKCLRYLCDALAGSETMCPMCNVWTLSEAKKKKPKPKKKRTKKNES